MSRVSATLARYPPLIALVLWLPVATVSLYLVELLDLPWGIELAVVSVIGGVVGSASALVAGWVCEWLRADRADGMDGKSD